MQRWGTRPLSLDSVAGRWPYRSPRAAATLWRLAWRRPRPCSCRCSGLPNLSGHDAAAGAHREASLRGPLAVHLGHVECSSVGAGPYHGRQRRRLATSSYLGAKRHGGRVRSASKSPRDGEPPILPTNLSPWTIALATDTPFAASVPSLC